MTGCLNQEFISMGEFEVMIHTGQQVQCHSCDAPKGAFQDYFCEYCQPPYYSKPKEGKCFICQYFGNLSYEGLSYNFTQCIARDLGCEEQKYEFYGLHDILLDDVDEQNVQVYDKQVRCMDLCPLPYGIKNKQCQICEDGYIVHYNQTCELNKECQFIREDEFDILVVEDNITTFNQSVCYGNDLDDKYGQNYCKYYIRLNESMFYCVDKCEKNQFLDFYLECLYIACNDNAALIVSMCKPLSKINDVNLLFYRKNYLQIYNDQVNNVTNLANIQSIYKSTNNCNDILTIKYQMNNLCVYCPYQYVIIPENYLSSSEYEFKCNDDCEYKMNKLVNQQIINQQICIPESFNCTFNDNKYYVYDKLCLQSCEYSNNDIQYYNNKFNYTCTTDILLNEYFDEQGNYYDVCDKYLIYHGNEEDFNKEKSLLCKDDCDTNSFYIYVNYDKELNKQLLYCYNFNIKLTKINIQLGQNMGIDLSQQITTVMYSNYINNYLNNSVDKLNILQCQTYIEANKCSYYDDCKLKVEFSDYKQHLSNTNSFYITEKTCLLKNDQQTPDITQQKDFQADLCNENNFYYSKEQNICLNCENYFDVELKICIDTCDDSKYKYLNSITLELNNYNIFTCIVNCELSYDDLCYIIDNSEVQNKCPYNLKLYQHQCVSVCRNINLIDKNSICVSSDNCNFISYSQFQTYTAFGDLYCQQSCGIELIKENQLCYSCRPFIEAVNTWNNTCIDSLKCKYIYQYNNRDLCGELQGLFIPECQFIIKDEKYCISETIILQSKDILQIECQKLQSSSLQLLQFKNSCSLKCQQNIATFTNENQVYPLCQNNVDKCDIFTNLYQQELKICYNCTFYSIDNELNKCKNKCNKYILNNTCQNHCPNKMKPNEENICIETVHKTPIIVYIIPLIIGVLIICGVVIFIVKLVKNKKQFNALRNQQFNVQKIRSSKVQLQMGILSI